MAKAGRRILLVDDDKFICHLYEFHLKSVGFEVEIAEDGVRAVKMIKSKKPDLILLDIIMPEKNGFEVLQEIKQDDEVKSVPVIILTNLSQKSDMEECLRLGAVEFLVKDNYMVDQVIEKINLHLKSD